MGSPAPVRRPRESAAILAALFCAVAPAGQQPPEPKNWTAAEDRQNMMDQLGIKSLRPGPSGNEAAPNHANYDEALANPFPQLPEVLTRKNRKKVTSARMWWEQRRPEIVEDFEREVLGRVPRNVPKVTWTVTGTVREMVGAYPVIGKKLVGHVDNSSYRAINVDIQLVLVTPDNGAVRAPVMVMFRGGGLPGAPQPAFPGRGAPPAGSDPPATEQLLVPTRFKDVEYIGSIRYYAIRENSKWHVYDAKVDTICWPAFNRIQYVHDTIFFVEIENKQGFYDLATGEFESVP